MNFPLFLSRRIYSEQGSDNCKVSQPAIRIAVAGVATGIAVMLISVCVVFGFKHAIHDKITGFGSHIQVAEFMTLLTPETLPVAMDSAMMETLGRIHGVRHVQRYTAKQGILKTDNNFLGIMLKGIGQEYDTTFIHENIVEGYIPVFTDTASTNSILLSKTMTDKLFLKCGDRVFAYFIDDNGVRTRRFTIAGIYQTNLSQYDDVTCFTDIYTTTRLNGWESDQVTGAELTVNDFRKVDETEAIIRKDINRAIDKYGNTYVSKTIREMNGQLFSWLDLLDLNVWIILIIMLAVAGVTMCSGLLIIILERTRMIGVLKALGAKNATIQRTFLWFATFVIGKGLIIGNALGLGLIFIQTITGFVKLDPENYYVSTAPVEINIAAIVALNVLTMVFCLSVLIIPSFFVSHIHPAKSMRYE